MGLEKYRKKRDFARTPEPAGEPSARLRPEAAASGGGRASLRRAETRGAAPSLRLPPGDGGRPAQLGGAQGAQPRPGRETPRRAGRGSPHRVRRLRRGHSGRPVWRRDGDPPGTAAPGARSKEIPSPPWGAPASLKSRARCGEKLGTAPGCSSACTARRAATTARTGCSSRSVIAGSPARQRRRRAGARRSQEPSRATTPIEGRSPPIRRARLDLQSRRREEHGGQGRAGPGAGAAHAAAGAGGKARRRCDLLGHGRAGSAAGAAAALPRKIEPELATLASEPPSGRALAARDQVRRLPLAVRGRGGSAELEAPATPRTGRRASPSWRRGGGGAAGRVGPARRRG